MIDHVIKVENLSKMYDLGLVGTGTLSKDLNRTWARLWGKPDPYLTLAEINDKSLKSKSDVVYAIKDLSFNVKKGQVLGIIGKNGAGKSTLLKLLSQITSPSSGEIKLKGRVASLLEVGTGMHPEMTAKQNIYLNGSLMGMSRKEIKIKFDEIVAFAGIEKYIDTPVKRFSSGMTVRLGFAIAAFLEPEILIVDEVLAVGDAEFQKKAIGKMKNVSNSEGRTVLFVSHNMAAVKNLCDSAIVLKNGEICYSGNVNDAIKEYLKDNKSNNVYKGVNSSSNNINILEFSVNPKLDDVINISNGFYFFLKFQNQTINKNLDVTFEVISENDILIFHHGKIISNNKDSKKGNYLIRGNVPGNLLNAGLYRINIIFGENQKNEILRKENIIQFEVINESFVNNNEILPGLIRPEIEYTVEFKNE